MEPVYPLQAVLTPEDPPVKNSRMPDEEPHRIADGEIGRHSADNGGHPTNEGGHPTDEGGMAEPHGAFRRALAEWFERVKRPLPWRETSDPWLIWMSEVLLQQTRVEQGLPYFEAFASAYPAVEDLASAELDDVLRLWEGLGYYARARNFHAAARQVVRDRGGELPCTREDWERLPGIGPYTAAAISSLAHGEAEAVVDGNVTRVITRLFRVDADAARAPARRLVDRLAQELLDTSDPGRHNEAMMELGATVCLPRSPRCDACPVSAWCQAAAAGDAERYPVKKKKAPTPHYTIAVGLLRDASGRFFVQRRPESAMLGGLWEFPGGKCEEGEPLAEALVREFREETGANVVVGERVACVKHAYSHFRITLHAFLCQLDSGSPMPATDLPSRWVEASGLSYLAFPRANRRIIDALTSFPGPWT